MKWKLLFVIVLFSSCRKSLANEQLIAGSEKTIVGKWKLIQYYKENTDGTGEWIPTDSSNIQFVEFSATGKFSHNANFVIQLGINSYKFLESHKILLYSTMTSDSVKYFYKQDASHEIIFNPLCLEFSCMRKFGKVY